MNSKKTLKITNSLFAYFFIMALILPCASIISNHSKLSFNSLVEILFQLLCITSISSSIQLILLSLNIKTGTWAWLDIVDGLSGALSMIPFFILWRLFCLIMGIVGFFYGIYQIIYEIVVDKMYENFIPLFFIALNVGFLCYFTFAK